MTSYGTRAPAVQFGVGNLVDAQPETYWATADEVRTATIAFDAQDETGGWGTVAKGL